MRFILIALMIITLFSCRDGVTGYLRGGTIITVKGDTITFYGGILTYSAFGSRSINGVIIEKER